MKKSLAAFWIMFFATFVANIYLTWQSLDSEHEIIKWVMK